jgi:hypothetical protein
MPTSLTPPPADDEIECANCGAYVYIELTRCPNCGISLYEPDGEGDERLKFHPQSGFSRAIESVVRKIKGEPNPAEELFTGALREKALYDDLLRKAGGDRFVVERLLAYERQQKPNATCLTCLQNAISRWERE